MTKVRRLYIQVLTLPHYVFYKIPVKLYGVFNHFLIIAELAYSSDKNTLYPDEKRKRKYSIFYDLLKWYILYKEINENYYIYGMDRAGLDYADQFMGMKKFKKMRNQRNYNPSVGGEARYNFLCLLRDKFIFSNYLTSLSLPAVENWAVFNKENLRWIESDQVFNTESFFSNSDLNLDCFCKELDGGKGSGAFTLRVAKNKLYFNNRLMAFEEIKSQMKGNYVLQERIVQHPILDKIYKHSINSLRIVTIYNRGKIEFFSGFFRTGSDGRNIDNYSAGGIIVGVDLDKGELMDYGIHNKEKPVIIHAHPDSGVSFSGFSIPYFQEVIELLHKTHSWFYGLHSVGWDIAITEKGPVLIEGNDRWGGKIMMSLKKDFKKDFINICENRDSDFISL